MTTPATKNPSELTRQESRAANEGMLNVPPPDEAAHSDASATAEASVPQTCAALEGVLEAQLLATRAYETAVKAVEAGPNASVLEALRAELQADADGVRILLARLHEQSEPKPPQLLATLTRGAQRVASVFGESATIGTLVLGEVALKGYMEDVLETPALLPMAREALTRKLMPSCVRRREQLRGMA